MGFKYIEAEISRESNEQLLNNLYEGVLIIDEETAEVHFKNDAAVRINRRLKDASNYSLIKEYDDKLIVHEPKFQLMDYGKIKNEDSQHFMSRLEADQVPAITMNDIIRGMLMSEEQKLNDSGSQIYRIAQTDSNFLNSSLASEKELNLDDHMSLVR